MIDPTKSPTAPWKRTATVILLAVLVVVAGWVLWTKELHHSPASSAPPATPAAAAPAHAAAAPKTAPVATTIPGGLPESNRNPFGG